MLWVKICLLKSNWQRHGVCHSLLSALPWKFFYFWKYFLFGPEHHSNGPENNNTYGPKKKRAGKVWAGKTWAGSSAYQSVHSCSYSQSLTVQHFLATDLRNTIFRLNSLTWERIWPWKSSVSNLNILIIITRFWNFYTATNLWQLNISSSLISKTIFSG